MTVAPSHALRMPPLAAPAVVPIPAPIRIALPVRLAFYVFALSIPFEMPNRTIPVEVTSITAGIFLLASLLNFSTVYRRVPAAFWWFCLYLWFYGLSTLLNRSDHVGEVTLLFVSFVELMLVLWAGGNVLRDRRAMHGALVTFAFACFVRAAMQVLGIAASHHAEWTGGYRTTVLGQNPNYSAIILSAGFVAVLNLRQKLIAWLGASSGWP
jgi:hypothetical protein